MSGLGLEEANLAPTSAGWADPEMPKRFETKSGARGTSLGAAELPSLIDASWRKYAAAEWRSRKPSIRWDTPLGVQNRTPDELLLSWSS